MTLSKTLRILTCNSLIRGNVVQKLSFMVKKIKISLSQLLARTIPEDYRSPVLCDLLHVRLYQKPAKGSGSLFAQVFLLVRMLPMPCIQQRAGNSSLCPHITEVGRKLWRLSGPTLLLKAGPDCSGPCPCGFFGILA